jgi:cytoskeletal protein CcmA (bactofilin family)
MLAANAVFTGNVTVSGNLNVSGSQSLDGVLFANGGIQMPGMLSSNAVSSTYLSTTLADIRTLRVTTRMDAPNVSATALDLTGGLRVSGTTRVQNLVVNGNLQVSGSQTIDGVSFANGGLSATGIITATTFAGSGAGLTNLPASGIVAAGSVGSVQYRGASGEISGTAGFTYSAAAQLLTMPGMVSVTNVRLATNGAEVCDANGLGTMRFNSASGKLQLCRP